MTRLIIKNSNYSKGKIIITEIMQRNVVHHDTLQTGLIFSLSLCCCLKRPLFVFGSKKIRSKKYYTKFSIPFSILSKQEKRKEG